MGAGVLGGMTREQRTDSVFWTFYTDRACTPTPEEVDAIVGVQMPCAIAARDARFCPAVGFLWGEPIVTPVEDDLGVAAIRWEFPVQADNEVMSREDMIDEAVRRVWAKDPVPVPAMPRGRYRDFYVFRLYEMARAIADIRAEFRGIAQEAA